jgi:hypothetical protein
VVSILRNRFLAEQWWSIMAKEKLVELGTFQKDFLIVGILFCIRDGIFPS